MSTTAPEPYDIVDGRVRTPPAPGSESAGPALAELVVATRQAVQAELNLYRQAQLEARTASFEGTARAQTDATGDAVLPLFSVPGGRTGHLMYAALDEAGVTPASPDTNGNLWHAIYAASAMGNPTAAGVVAVGGMLDCSPQNPGVDAQIPFVYLYGSPDAAPTLVGPATFYLVIDAATASRLVACRWRVLTHTPEP